MSSRCDQNGRQPPLSGQPQNLSDTETQNENLSQTEKKKDICRKFIWGTCNKNTQCIFRHDLDFEEMKRVLRFCHDYQNPLGCTREHCTYLHATKEEENLFFATGQLPRVLAERHANMSVAVAETIPQIALYIQESLVGHTPPPPPPQAPVSAPPPPTPTPTPSPLPLPVTTVSRQSGNMHSLQQLLPPPPPPTVPSTVPISQGPVFTAPPPQNTAVYSVAPPPPSVLLKFDASRPPPPISTKVPTVNGCIKRPASNDSDAAPCKVRKKDEEKDAVAHCDQCEKREISVETLREEMSKLQREEECQVLFYKQRFIEYQNRKNILRSLVNEELYNVIEEYIEQSVSNSEIQEALAKLGQSSTMLPGISAIPKQFLLQLVDYIFGNGRKFDNMPSSTVRLDETLLQTLTTTRRTNSSPKSDIRNTFMDIMKQSNGPADPGSLSGFSSDILKSSDFGSDILKSSDFGSDILKTSDFGSDVLKSSDFGSDILKNIGSNTIVNGCHRITKEKIENHVRIAQSSGQSYQKTTRPPAPSATPALPAPPAPAPTPAPTPVPAPAKMTFPPPYQPPQNGNQLSTPRVPPPPPTAPPALTPAPPATSVAPAYNVARYPPAFYQQRQ